MNQNSKIGIIGCGWLGFALAKKLISENYQVKGSTTSIEKIEKFNKHNIEPCLLQINEDEIIGEISTFLKNLNILIISIPPKSRKNSSSSYLNKIRRLNEEIQKSSIKKIIFISSTSVYGSTQGEVDSNIIANPNTANGALILESEKFFNNKYSTVIRFGGLIGNDRNPVFFLIKKLEIKNSLAPINLIHLDDCIGIISSIINKNMWGKVFSAVAPYHPSKKEYYTKKSIEFGLGKLNFSELKTKINKQISDNKIKDDLNYSFIYPKL
jgi:nucleoside-diphosphate-sugar epimerase